MKKRPKNKLTSVNVSKNVMQMLGPDVQYLDEDDKQDVEGTHKSLHSGIR